MKTIAQLQQEIRYIRMDMQKLDARLEDLTDQLNHYMDVTPLSSIYQQIYRIAESMPIIEHPICHMSRETKKNYMGVLLMIATLEGPPNDNQLLFLQRMIMKDDTCSQIDFYIGNLGTLHPENILFNLEDSLKDTYSKPLILDMLMIARLSNQCTVKSYEMIMNISAFLKIDKANIQTISEVAVSVLTNTAMDIEDTRIISMHEQYGYYLSEVMGWNQRVKKVLIQRLLYILVA